MREQQGNPYQTPVKLRTNAPRQTEEQARYRQPRTPRVADEEIDDGWTPPKSRTSAVRFDSPRRTTNLPDPKQTRVISQGQGRFTLARFLVIFGLFLFVLALGILAFNGMSTWWQLHTDDATYGRPRTFQIDQYVGHGDSQAHPNHFVVVNLKGLVEVVEINTQDVKLDHAYYITTTSNALSPVTLSFPTVDGKQYMYVSIGDQDTAYTVVLVNDGKEFTGAQH